MQHLTAEGGEASAVATASVMVGCVSQLIAQKSYACASRLFGALLRSAKVVGPKGFPFYALDKVLLSEAADLVRAGRSQDAVRAIRFAAFTEWSIKVSDHMCNRVGRILAQLHAEWVLVEGPESRRRPHDQMLSHGQGGAWSSLGPESGWGRWILNAASVAEAAKASHAFEKRGQKLTLLDPGARPRRVFTYRPDLTVPTNVLYMKQAVRESGRTLEVDGDWVEHVVRDSGDFVIAALQNRVDAEYVGYSQKRRKETEESFKKDADGVAIYKYSNRGELLGVAGRRRASSFDAIIMGFYVIPFPDEQIGRGATWEVRLPDAYVPVKFKLLGISGNEWTVEGSAVGQTWVAKVSPRQLRPIESKGSYSGQQWDTQAYRSVLHK